MEKIAFYKYWNFSTVDHDICGHVVIYKQDIYDYYGMQWDSMTILEQEEIMEHYQ